jgi:quercetin dioxygenase-like cupin family protein
LQSIAVAKGEPKMELKSTLKVVNAAEIRAQAGVTEGQTMKRLVGCPEIPTDRVRAGLATYKAGTVEELHWHPIESFDFVISGHAVVRDIEGNEYEVGPGSFIYAPPGIAGAHEWEVKEGLQLVAFRATPESEKKLQFTVDKKTKRSYIDLDELAKRDGISFKSHY